MTTPAPPPEAITPQARAAARAAVRAVAAGSYTWEMVADAALDAAWPDLAAVARESIRQGQPVCVPLAPPQRRSQSRAT